MDFHWVVVLCGGQRAVPVVIACSNRTCSFALMQKNQKIKAVYRF